MNAWKVTNRGYKFINMNHAYNAYDQAMADQKELLAMLERMDNELCELRDRCRSVSMPEDSYDEIDPDSIFPNVLREARALLAKIKGE